MKIAICDDEKIFVDKVCQYVEDAAVKSGQKFYISTFNCGRDFIKASQMEAFDAVFLDIAMPGENGFDIAEQLIEIRPNTGIIFVSSKETMVFNSYKYSPLWFVPKSQMELVETAMKKIITKIEMEKQDSKLLALRIERNKIISVDLRELLYIRSESHYLKYYTSEGSSADSFRNTLENIEAQLLNYGFVRCHERYLVNLRKISFIESTECILLNGERIPISRSKMAQTKISFQNHLRSFE